MPVLSSLIPSGTSRASARLGAVVLALATGWASLAGSAWAAPSPAVPLAATDTLSATVSPQPLPYGSTATVSGLLRDAAGSPVAGAPVVVDAQTAEGTWIVVAGPMPTDAAGSVALTVAPTASSVVRLRHDSPDGAASAPLTVAVRASLTASPSAPQVRAGRPVRISGTLAPAGDGATVRLQQRIDGRWRAVTQALVAPDGTWSGTVVPPAAGYARYRAVAAASPGVGGTVVVLAPLEVFRLHRYSVSTRGRVTADLDLFREVVAATYADPRGWARGHHRFREVPRGGAFTVVLAQAATVAAFHPECSAFYSCRVGRYVVINQDRWRRGSPYFDGDLTTYRQMVVNHETGHWLGRGHASCPGPGRPAPVMQQQSKGLAGCRANAWPLAREVRAVS